MSHFYRLLIAQGWEREAMQKLILEACRYVQQKANTTNADNANEPAGEPTNNDDENQLFIHLKYHPDDIPCQLV